MVRRPVVGIISVRVMSVVVVVVVVRIVSHPRHCLWWCGYGGAVNVVPPPPSFPLHVSHCVVVGIVIALIVSHCCCCCCLWWWHDQVRGRHEDGCVSHRVVIASGDSMTR